jgi:hypothetical protein
MKQEAVSNNIHKKRKNPPLKERDGCMLLRRIGQALLARGLISHVSSTLNRKGCLHATQENRPDPSGKGSHNHASSALNRKGWLRAAQWSRPGPSGKGSHKPRQQHAEQKGRVDEI